MVADPGRVIPVWLLPRCGHHRRSARPDEAPQRIELFRARLEGINQRARAARRAEIEGIIVGAFGAVLAIVVLGVTKLAVLDPLANNFTLIAAPRTIPFIPLLLVLVGAGVAVSALGSGLSLRRFLRV